jgi:hypothetical protein
MRSNMVEYEIEDGNMWFMGCKSMGNDCTIVNKAAS